MTGINNVLHTSAEYGFEEWHRVTCQNFSNSECRRESGQTFRAQVFSRRFGGFILSEVSSFALDGVRMNRGHAEIRKDPRDYFMCYVVLKGRIDLEQDKRQGSATPGDLILYDQAMPFALNLYRHHAILLNIPRALLVSRIPEVRGFTARRIAGASRLGMLAGTILRQIADFEASTNAEIESRLAMSVIDIIATTLKAELADAKKIGSSGESVGEIDGVRRR
jgi:hypothetical protein